MEIYCSHATKVVHRRYFNRCPTCGAEWYSVDPVPLVVIGHTNADDVIVNNFNHSDIEKKVVVKEESKVAKWWKRVWNRVVWATQGNQVSYSEAVIYECQFCNKKFSQSFFKDICSQCVRKAVVKVLSDGK